MVKLQGEGANGASDVIQCLVADYEGTLDQRLEQALLKLKIMSEGQQVIEVRGLKPYGDGPNTANGFPYIAVAEFILGKDGQTVALPIVARAFLSPAVMKKNYETLQAAGVRVQSLLFSNRDNSAAGSYLPYSVPEAAKKGVLTSDLLEQAIFLAAQLDRVSVHGKGVKGMRTDLKGVYWTSLEIGIHGSSGTSYFLERLLYLATEVQALANQQNYIRTTYKLADSSSYDRFKRLLALHTEEKPGETHKIGK